MIASRSSSTFARSSRRDSISAQGPTTGWVVQGGQPQPARRSARVADPAATEGRGHESSRFRHDLRVPASRVRGTVPRDPPHDGARVIELRPMTPAFIEAVLDDRREDASAELDVELPPEFPREGERRFIALRLRQMREDERFETWCPSVVVLDGRMIGHAGYHGPPGNNSTQNPDAVEFGYAIYPEWRGRGYATQAAVMLMDQAEELAGIRHFVLAVAPGQRSVDRDRPQARLRQDGRAHGRGGRPRARLRASALRRYSPARTLVRTSHASPNRASGNRPGTRSGRRRRS